MNDTTELNLDDLNPYEGDKSILLAENESGLWKGLVFDPVIDPLATQFLALKDNKLVLNNAGGGGGGTVTLGGAVSGSGAVGTTITTTLNATELSLPLTLESQDSIEYSKVGPGYHSGSSYFYPNLDPGQTWVDHYVAYNYKAPGLVGDDQNGWRYLYKAKHGTDTGYGYMGLGYGGSFPEGASTTPVYVSWCNNNRSALNYFKFYVRVLFDNLRLEQVGDPINPTDAVNLQSLTALRHELLEKVDQRFEQNKKLKKLRKVFRGIKRWLMA